MTNQQNVCVCVYIMDYTVMFHQIPIVDGLLSTYSTQGTRVNLYVCWIRFTATL